jgi:hypothetical protein
VYGYDNIAPGSTYRSLTYHSLTDLGVQRGGEENLLELNPRMHGSLRLEPTDQIAVLGDAF